IRNGIGPISFADHIQGPLIVQSSAVLIGLLNIKVGVFVLEVGTITATGHSNQLIVAIQVGAHSVQGDDLGAIVLVVQGDIDIHGLSGAVGLQDGGLPKPADALRCQSSLGDHNILVLHGTDVVAVDDEQVAVDFHEAIGLTQGDGGN